jgi:ABC-2 type transport system permease protein
MNKNVVLAVARRDLKSWFGNPTGYVFIILFVGLAVVALLWQPEFFRNNLANLDTLNGWFPYIAVLFAAAITMGTWSSERSSGTQELLFTLPARDSELLTGKYVAAFGVYTLSLLFTLTLPIGLSFLGTPDWGQLFCNYLGYWLFGGMLIAATMVGSQLSDNLTVSLLAGIGVGALVVFSGLLVQLLGFGPGWTLNGPWGQFQDFARGMIGSGGILLFVGLAVTFLQLNLALLARRHHRPGQLEGVHGGVRFVALAAAVGAVTVIGVNMLPRLDGTIERIHSLSSESKKLLAELDPKRPVFVTAFVSEEVPVSLVQQKRNLLNLIDQFDRIGGDAVQQRVVVTDAFSPEAQDAEKNYGITARTLPSDEGGNYTEMSVFLGFVVQSGPEEVVVPFVEPALPLEYELTRSIRVAAKADRRKVGVLKTDVELYGGFDFQTFQQKTRWQIVEDLQLQYKIENVDADKDYPAGLDALVVPQPLVQEQMDRLQNWILAGNNALLLEDPAPLDAPGTAATDPKGGARAQMMGGGGPQKGNFAGFCGNLGIAMATDQVLWDTSYRTFGGGQLPPEFVFVGEPGFAQDDPVTKGLDRAVVMFGGFVTPQKKDGWTFKPLMRSPMPAVGANDANGLIGKLNLFVFNPFGGQQQLDPRRRHTRVPNDYVVAARVTGKAPEGKTKAPQIIFCADLDMFGNQFFGIRRAYNDPNMRFDNVAFVLNAIDSLVGDESLIELRKRQPKLRSLTAVEKAQETYETRWIDEKEKAEDAAKTELDNAQKRLDDAVAALKENKELDEQAKEIQLQTIQNNEQRKLDISKARIEEQKRGRIEIARHERDTGKARLYNGYRVMMLLLAPLPALAMGLMTFVRRRAREAAIVPQNRLVK